MFPKLSEKLGRKDLKIIFYLSKYIFSLEKIYLGLLYRNLFSHNFDDLHSERVILYGPTGLRSASWSMIIVVLW